MAGLLDFIKTPRSDNPNRKASLADRSQVYNLLDNIIGFNDDRVTPGEALGAGLRNDPIGLLSGAVRGVQGDLNNLMFEGQAMQRPFDVMGYAAAPMAPGAMSGRMANVLSSGGAKPTLDQMRANARQRIADRAKMVQDLTQDASPVRMKSGDLSVLVSKSPDREGWRVTYFQPDGSPSGHVDAKDKSGAVQRALEDQFTPIAARPAPTPSRPLNPAEQMAKDVLDMRAAGRAGEVTEEMRAAADPQYMYFNTPLPMDEASRMARGVEQGRRDEFHGTTTGSDMVAPDAFRGSEARQGIGFVTSDNPYVASSYADPSFGSVFPMLNTPLPSSAPRIDVGGNVWSDISVDAPVTLGDRVVTARDLSVEPADVGGVLSTNQLSRGASFDSPGIEFTNIMDRSIHAPRPRTDDGMEIMREFQRLASDPSNVTMRQDTRGMRSRFALFDPEFKHLRNLSAGVGGMGLLGMSYPQEGQY